MKILIISRYPPFPGGRENFVLELSDNLALNNTVYILTPDTESNKGRNPSIFKYPESETKLREIIENFQPDIINSHTFYLSDTAIKIARDKNIPFGITLHGDQFAIGDKQRQDVVSRISKEADFVINVSTNGKDSIIKNVSGIDTNKIFVINNGVNLNKFNKQKREKRIFRDEFDIRQNRFVVLTPTRIAPYKGINFLLDAIIHAKEIFSMNNFLFLISVPDYKFSDEEKAQFDDINKKIRTLGLNNLVKFVFNRYEDMYKLYNVADIFVLPSEKEQFPMSILEAMASDVPVIATNVGGIPELLSDGNDALLVNFGDLTALNKAIQLLFEKQDLALTIKNSARHKVEKTYSIADVAEKYLDIFKKYKKDENN